MQCRGCMPCSRADGGEQRICRHFCEQVCEQGGLCCRTKTSSGDNPATICRSTDGCLAGEDAGDSGKENAPPSSRLGHGAVRSLEPHFTRRSHKLHRSDRYLIMKPKWNRQRHLARPSGGVKCTATKSIHEPSSPSGCEHARRYGLAVRPSRMRMDDRNQAPRYRQACAGLWRQGSRFSITGRTGRDRRPA